MSITVSFIPFLLISAVINIATGSRLEQETKSSNFLNNFIETDGKNHISKKEFENFICKEYQTVFLDKDVLLKTLSEHGVGELNIFKDKITCKADGFNMTFTQENSSLPYKLEISCGKSVNPDEKISDIDSEYTRNVQEATYLKIKENLAKNNLKIDNEEVFEDDSIVLTVNLD